MPVAVPNGTGWFSVLAQHLGNSVDSIRSTATQLSRETALRVADGFFAWMELLPMTPGATACNLHTDVFCATCKKLHQHAVSLSLIVTKLTGTRSIRYAAPAAPTAWRRVENKRLTNGHGRFSCGSSFAEKDNWAVAPAARQSHFRFVPSQGLFRGRITGPKSPARSPNRCDREFAAGAY